MEKRKYLCYNLFVPNVFLIIIKPKFRKYFIFYFSKSKITVTIIV